MTGPERSRDWRGSLRLLRGPLRTLVLGQSLGQFGDGVAQVAFAQLVVFDIGRGASPGRIAAVFAVTLLPFCVVGPLAGVLIDRWDRRRTLIIASAARSVLVLAAIAAAVWQLEPLAYLGVVLLLSSSRFVLDAKGAVLPRLVGAPDLVRANAMSALLGAGSGFIGAVSAAMFVSWSVVLGFLVAGGSYLLASVCFGSLPAVGGLGRPAVRLGEALGQLAGDLRNGAAAIVRQRQLRRPLAAVSTHRLLLGAGFVLLVLIADHRYHLSTTGYGLAIAVTGVATVIGAVSAPWLTARWRPECLLALSFLPPAAAIAVCGYAPTLAGLLAALGVTAVSFQLLKVITDALLGAGAPDAVRGRVFSIYDVLYNLAFVLAGLAMIPLWRPGHERALLWWLATAFGLGWLVMARVVGSWPYLGGGASAAVVIAAHWRLRLLALLSGGLLVVIFPKPSLSWAAWLVLVPWLLIRRAPTRREAAIRAWWSALGFLLAVHYWLLPSLTVFLPLVTGLLATMWLAWGALSWQLLSGELTARKLLASLAIVPAGWVMIEAIRSWSALGGPWGMLGASQWRAPAMLAPASLGGVWLVSFMVVAVNVAVTVLLDAGRARPRLLAGAIALAVLAAGPAWYRAESPTGGTATLPVAVIEAGMVHDPQQRLAGEIAATERLPAGAVGLVIWGESSVGFDLFSRPDLQRRLERLAARVGADLLVNVDAAAPDGSIRKTAVLIGPDAILSSYRKMRLVPFGEYIPLRPALGWLSSITKAAALNRERGSHLVVMRDGATAFAPLVCFESAFPDLSRAASRQGARLLIFQSATTTFQGSWAQDQQASLAALRAMEVGRPVVNATLAGTSAAFTARGQRLLWWPAASGTATALVPLATRDTPYDRFGDWVLAWCLILLAAFAIASSLTGTDELRLALDKGRCTGRECALTTPSAGRHFDPQILVEPPVIVTEEEPMALRRRRNRIVTVPLVTVASIAAFLVGIPDAQAASQVPLSGTGSPVTGPAPPSGIGDVTQAEYVGQTDEEAAVDAYPGVINDRSLSDGGGHGPTVAPGPKAKSSPKFTTGFEGLNLYQQRYARRGNQFTVEPPDQALCVGNGYVLEAVNDVLNIFNSAGQSVLPDNTAANVVSGFPRDVNHAVDLNSFYGYGPAINRSTGVRAQSITDPTCIYDAATNRFFLVVLTLESQPNGVLTHVNHLNLAVSQTSNPTGSWNIYKIDVTNDGTNAGGVNPGPYLGDYPHIGADANGIYLTTNAYPWNSNGFAGAQIYALSKAQLAAGSANVNAVHIDTFGKVNVPSDAGATQPGFTVWPAHSPGTSSYDANAGGTEYLLSSNAADEATHPVTGTGGNYVSNQIITWALTNTSSLNTATPDLRLSTKVLSSNTYAIPPKQKQQGAGTTPGTPVPQGHCINDTTTSTIAGLGCWRLLFNSEPAHNEVISAPDSNDTRMQQVMYANGKIWGALDTALNPGGTAQRAGIAWFIVKPDTSSGPLAAKMALQGYLGAAGSDLTYPTIGVTASGRGVMGFTYSGDAAYPSAAYAPIDALVGTGPWAVVPGGAGQAADDGFTSYKAQVGGNPPRTRWGDYGAAAVDGNHVWLASEHIAHSCDYPSWGGPFFTGGSGDNLLGTCAGASHGPGLRTALGNWSTRISELTL